MTHFRTLTLAFCLATLLPCFSQAAPVTIMGDFEGANFNAPVTPDPFQGSWSFNFDFDALDPMGGTQTISDIPLTSFEPVTIGSTVFDLSNTFGGVLFNPSTNVVFITVAGDPGGTGSSADEDDFAVSYLTASGIPSVSSVVSIDEIIVSNAGVSSLGFSRDSSGSATVIPEPSSLALLGMGGLAVTLCLRRSLRSQ